MPVDVQQRADAELGAAWRRCEAALPVVLDGRWAITVVRIQSGDGYFEPVEEGFKAFAKVGTELVFRGDLGPTPAAALDALTEALALR